MPKCEISSVARSLVLARIPFVISNAKFKWIPEQDFEEQICVPSEMLQYLDVIANPAGEVKSK